MKPLKSFINIDPGEFIKEELIARDWSCSDLARICGIPLETIQNICNNEQIITSEIAQSLSYAFGQSHIFWPFLKRKYNF